MTVIENLAYLRYFGFRLTFWKTMHRISYDLSKRNLSWWIHNKNFEAIEDYLRKTCAFAVEMMRNPSFDKQSNITLCDTDAAKAVKKNQTVWTMWWQGEDLAPPIVRACIESMRRYSGGREVIVIDKHNCSDYLCIPDVIWDRLKEGVSDATPLKKTVLSMTQFSDIARVLLLYQYGGLWMDATIFLTDDLPDTYFDAEWVTLGEDDRWYAAEGKCSFFFMGARARSPIMHCLFEMMIMYWQKRTYFVNYLMCYNMFNIVQSERSDLQALIENTDCGNEKVLTVNRNYGKAVYEEEIVSFLESQHVHKLSWKWWGNETDSPVFCEDEQGRPTWFGYLYRHYIEGMDSDTGRHGA